jgi:hypothetical protein
MTSTLHTTLVFERKISAPTEAVFAAAKPSLSHSADRQQSAGASKHQRFVLAQPDQLWDCGDEACQRRAGIKLLGRPTFDA